MMKLVEFDDLDKPVAIMRNKKWYYRVADSQALRKKRWRGGEYIEVQRFVSAEDCKFRSQKTKGGGVKREQQRSASKSRGK